jgi:hypothetical protein
MIQPRQGLTAADGNRAHCGERDDQRPPAVSGADCARAGTFAKWGRVGATSECRSSGSHGDDHRSGPLAW